MFLLSDFKDKEAIKKLFGNSHFVLTIKGPQIEQCTWGVSLCKNKDHHSVTDISVTSSFTFLSNWPLTGPCLNHLLIQIDSSLSLSLMLDAMEAYLPSYEHIFTHIDAGIPSVLPEIASSFMLDDTPKKYIWLTK